MKLPSEICVKISDVENGRPIFEAETDVMKLVEIGANVLVGTYKLVKTTRVQMVPEAQSAKNVDAEKGE